MKVNVKLTGIEPLEKKLNQLNTFRLDAVIIKNTTQLYNYMKSNTPRDTGWLMNNLFAEPKEGLVGYTPEYAPHVEYGHRTVNGGYVPGQHFLQKGVDMQREIYRHDLLNAIKKEGG